MARSEQQKAVLELGKQLVKDLGLEKGVDTLSRWMAHYVAEKIKYAESLPDGVKRNKAEKECFSLILDLWKHRGYYKSDRQPLRNFNRLFEILESLDPEKDRPYFFQWQKSQLEEQEAEAFKSADLKRITSLALQVDKVAKIWINYLFQEACRGANGEAIKKIISAAVELPESEDARIIQIVLSKSTDLGDGDLVDEDDLARKDNVKALDRRITELRRFKELNEYLIGRYEKDLNALKR